MPDQEEAVTVIQADRDAACAYAATHWLWPAPSVADMRRGGADWDAYHLVQAFARHRTSSSDAATPDGRVLVPRERLTTLATLLMCEDRASLAAWSLELVAMLSAAPTGEPS